MTYEFLDPGIYRQLQNESDRGAAEKRARAPLERRTIPNAIWGGPRSEEDACRSP